MGLSFKNQTINFSLGSLGNFLECSYDNQKYISC